jgi:hypothetical protein
MSAEQGMCFLNLQMFQTGGEPGAAPPLAPPPPPLLLPPPRLLPPLAPLEPLPPDAPDGLAFGWVDFLSGWLSRADTELVEPDSIQKVAQAVSTTIPSASAGAVSTPPRATSSAGGSQRTAAVAPPVVAACALDASVIRVAMSAKKIFSSVA